jgi:hypothetical protein
MTVSPNPAFGELPDKLQSLLRERGVAADAPIIPLKDGGNNQVYRLPGGGRDYVLKRYFQHPSDARDRFNTERVFYEFLWSGGLRQIPEPCGWDEEHRLGVFAFVPGRKLNPGEVTGEAVEEALEFVNRINALREHPAARAVPAASEACFSVAEQVECIAKRVAAIQNIEPQSEMDIRAAAFARDELLPAWHGTADAISRRTHADRALNEPLGPAKRCLSPSDFGFHNALLAEGARLHFIDFEYAGWDDPAKLACDFFCQPQVPVGFEFWDLFLNSLAAGPGGGDTLPRRAKLLLPAYQIKWCCIILNHFVKAGRARREFARGAAPEEAKAVQLEKARRLLHDIHKLRD